MNNVSLIANLTRDVELRYTPNGVAVATLGLAVNSGFGDNKETCFINATVWKKTAENASQYLHKGSKVAVTGSLKQRSWEDKEGNKKSVIEINAFNVEYLDPKSDSQGQASADTNTNAFEAEENVYIPGETEEEMF